MPVTAEVPHHPNQPFLPLSSHPITQIQRQSTVYLPILSPRSRNRRSSRQEKRTRRETEKKWSEHAVEAGRAIRSCNRAYITPYGLVRFCAYRYAAFSSPACLRSQQTQGYSTPCFNGSTSSPQSTGGPSSLWGGGQSPTRRLHGSQASLPWPCHVNNVTLVRKRPRTTPRRVRRVAPVILYTRHCTATDKGKVRRLPALLARLPWDWSLERTDRDNRGEMAARQH